MTRKRIAAAALLAAGTVAATAAWALPAYWIEYTYYSDATHQVVVGQRGFTCSARRYGFGEETEFYEQTREEWCGSGPKPD